MPSSFQNVATHDKSRLHAGHVYKKIINNFSSTSVPNNDDRVNSPSRALAPADSQVHEELCRAARQGQATKRLEYLIGQGANVDVIDDMCLTPLYYAALLGDLKNVRYLLDAGADVNAQHPKFGTPICIAALRGHVKIVRILLKHNAQLEVVPTFGSALHCACFCGSIPIVKALLSEGAARNQTATLSISKLYVMLEGCPIRWQSRDWEYLPLYRPPLKCSPVLLAVERFHSDLLREVWSTKPSESSMVNHLADYYYPPDESRWSFVQDDVTKTLQPHIRGTVADGQTISTDSAWSFLGFPRPASIQPSATLLMWAAASLRIDQINHLLKTGSDVKARDCSGRTALHYAAMPFRHAVFGNVGPCVRSLVQAGADLCIEPTVPSPLALIVDYDHPARDPRHMLGRNCDAHVQYLSEFLDAFACSSAKREASREALQQALMEEFCPLDSIKLLCRSSVPFEDSEGLADAMLCRCLRSVDYADETIVSMLLQHGANPNASDGNDTPLPIAINRGLPQIIVKLLLKYGANPDALPEGYIEAESSSPSESRAPDLERPRNTSGLQLSEADSHATRRATQQAPKSSRLSRLQSFRAYTVPFLGKSKAT